MRVARWRKHLGWRPATRMAVAVAVIFSLAACTSAAPARRPGATSHSGRVIALNDISTLRMLFNRDSGHPRLILIFSPTCPTCLAGASWVQGNILTRAGGPALRVLVVWVPFLGGTRSAINPSVLPDSRVTSLWDPNAVSSRWFSQHVTHQPGPCWDYYLLFSPRARWGAVPGPVVSQGGTVIAQSAQMLAAIRPLLR